MPADTFKEENKAMTGIAVVLKERFENAASWFLEGWEWEADGMIDETTIRQLSDQESSMVEIFEKLHDSVDQVPSSLMHRTEVLNIAVGPEKFEEVLVVAIQDVGHRHVPNDATEFLEILNRALHFRPTLVHR
jgi:hypothetical protein